MSSIVIKHARIVNEGQIVERDVLIEGERIEKIAKTIKIPKNATVIDAKGKHLLPGMIDDQVHFREPGLTHKAEIKTESRAAVAGGITTYFEMPNTTPPTTTAAALEAKYQLAGTKSAANFAFYLGASNDKLEDIKALDPQTACGIKIFMGASTGNMLVDDHDVLEAIFANAPIIIATHCEDTPMIQEQERKYRRLYGDDIPMSCHGEIRSREACLKSSTLATQLARDNNAKLHVLHLTTADELPLFVPGPIDGKLITAEVCVHHLAFNDRDYATLGTLIKCNPAIKTANDQIALLEALQEGRIDIIATDHAPHTWEEKHQPYTKAPSGLPLVQHALQSVLEFYHDGHLTLETIVEKTSHNVAKRFDVDQRGYIREGYYADVVLVDLDAEETVSKKSLKYKCGWSPFEGKTFRSTIDTTIVNGHLAYHDGKLTRATPGKRVTFARESK